MSSGLDEMIGIINYYDAFINSNKVSTVKEHSKAHSAKQSPAEVCIICRYLCTQLYSGWMTHNFILPYGYYTCLYLIQVSTEGIKANVVKSGGTKRPNDGSN